MAAFTMITVPYKGITADICLQDMGECACLDNDGRCIYCNGTGMMKHRSGDVKCIDCLGAGSCPACLHNRVVGVAVYCNGYPAMIEIAYRNEVHAIQGGAFPMRLLNLYNAHTTRWDYQAAAIERMMRYRRKRAGR